MTEHELAKIRTRADAATTGPWVYLDTDPFFGQIRDCMHFRHITDTPYLDDREADMQFIAHAREDIPNLLQEIDTLKGIISDLQQDSTAYQLGITAGRHQRQQEIDEYVTTIPCPSAKPSKSSKPT